MEKKGPVLFAGDCHGRFEQLIQAARSERACAVVLLGDMEPTRPLEVELSGLLELNIPTWWIGGNHDADSDDVWHRVWGSALASRCVHGRVVELPDGRRLAGLTGVFRGAVWNPKEHAGQASARWESREAHARATPRQSRWHGGPPRRHWGTIYPEDLQSLAQLRADVLVTHEAGGYHPFGFKALDELARRMSVQLHVHGHQHDDVDSSSRWEEQGFTSHGVGLRGVSALHADGSWTVIVQGEVE